MNEQINFAEAFSKTNKDTLAQLMAGEGITVEHDNYRTASFDTEHRILYMPIFDNMPSSVSDLLISHEVGHALWTPVDWYKDETGEEYAEEHAGMQSYLNICEDVRIERMIRQKYPGLIRCYVDGYRWLYNNLFFGDMSNLDSMILIDRINIHFKLSGIVPVPFSPEEYKFVKRVDAATEYEEIREIAQEIYDREWAIATTSLDSDFIKFKQQSKSVDMDYDDQYGNFSGVGVGGTGVDRKEDEIDFTASELTQPVTTDQFLNSMKNHVVQADTVAYEITVPTCYKAKDLVLPFHEAFANGSITTLEKITQDKVIKEFNDQHDKVISYLIKEFEFFKAASVARRTRITSSGEIDPSKIGRYKVDENIFRNIEQVADGKNHSFVVLLDLSGSMNTVIGDAVVQCLVLAEFARRQKIPLRVLGFTDSHDFLNTHDNYGNQLTNFDRLDRVLYDLLDTRDSRAEYRDKFATLFLSTFRTNLYGYGGRLSPELEKQFEYTFNIPRLYLNGTPLFTALLCIPTVLREYREQTKVDVCNLIVVTDGAPAVMNIVTPNTYNRFPHANYAATGLNSCRQYVTIRDPKHAVSVSGRVGGFQTAIKLCLDFIKKTVDVDTSNVFIANEKFETCYRLVTLEHTMDAITEASKKFTKYKSVAITGGVYKSSIIINKNSLHTETEDYDISSKTTVSGISSVLKKYLKNTIHNKVILREFIKEITHNS